MSNQITIDYSKFYKSGLSTGMVVKLVNGDLYQVYNTYNCDINMLIKTDIPNTEENQIKVKRINLDMYDDELRTKNRDFQYNDIIQVYRIASIGTKSLLGEITYTLVYDRHNICIKCDHKHVCKYDYINNVDKCVDFL